VRDAEHTTVLDIDKDVWAMYEPLVLYELWYSKPPISAEFWDDIVRVVTGVRIWDDATKEELVPCYVGYGSFAHPLDERCRLITVWIYRYPLKPPIRIGGALSLYAGAEAYDIAEPAKLTVNPVTIDVHGVIYRFGSSPDYGRFYPGYLAHGVAPEITIPYVDYWEFRQKEVTPPPNHSAVIDAMDLHERGFPRCIPRCCFADAARDYSVWLWWAHSPPMVTGDHNFCSVIDRGDILISRHLCGPVEVVYKGVLYSEPSNICGRWGVGWGTSAPGFIRLRR